jgi:DNA-binding transcriptional MerR regulator
VEKAPDAFRTISEVADELDVPQHVLRFWESRFRDIKPMKRGGGRRYYRPDDIELLRGIRHLLYGEGYTIRGVQRILREQGAKFVQAVWQPGAPQPLHGGSEEAEAADAGNTRRTGSDDSVVPAAEERVRYERPPARSASSPVSPAAGELREVPHPVATEGRREPRMDALTPPPARSLPQAEPEPPTGRPPQGLAPEAVRRLQGVLTELGECRKLLDAAFAPSP